ncbi:hypothetical protein GW932_02660 [archaeon]|nr:hypothetical protein [archaeon]
MGESFQKKLEQKVYDILFDLEDELDLDVKKLPEIYYVGKNFNFYSLNIDGTHFFTFEYVKKNNIAAFLPHYSIILSRTLNEGVLAEENGHFLFEQFKVGANNPADYFARETLSEMIGFFSSKLVDSKRKNNLKRDSLDNSKSIKDIFDTVKLHFDSGNEEDLIHEQGYMLGEKLYHKYISNQISKKEIKKFILKPLKGKFETFYEFYNWKYHILR